MELQKLETQDKENARQHEINLKRLDHNFSVLVDPVQNNGFRLSAAIKFAPAFHDVDMTQFLNALEKVETPLLSDGDMSSRAKLVELQRSDRSLDKLFSLAHIRETNNAVSYFAIRNDVLVRHSRYRFMHVGLEVTQIVVPKQFQGKLLTVAHEYQTSGHLRLKGP